MRRLLLLLSLSLLVVGCATMPGDPAKMTAEQIREAVKDKNASIGCGATETPYKINVVLVVLDRLVVRNGTLTVGRDCTITITNTEKPTQ